MRPKRKVNQSTKSNTELYQSVILKVIQSEYSYSEWKDSIERISQVDQLLARKRMVDNLLPNVQYDDLLLNMVLNEAKTVLNLLSDMEMYIKNRK